MATHEHSPRDRELEQELAGLRQEYERLRDDKVRTEQDLNNVSAQLAELQQQARDTYGTDDPEELERILAQKRAENERLVAEYREHIRSINAALDQVEADVAPDAGEQA